MFAAVLAVLSQIQIPMPSGMPVTLQTYAVALTGFLLGSRYGTATVGIYILLGAVGLPVFTGFTGGPGKLVGTTGGFIWGFLILAAACGGVRAGEGSEAQGILLIWKKYRKILLPAAGLAVCHVLGAAQFAAVMQMDFLESALLVSVPYWIKDILSVLFAYITAKSIRRRLSAELSGL